MLYGTVERLGTAGPVRRWFRWQGREGKAGKAGKAVKVEYSPP
jgi:hypothetical protein